MTAVLVIGDLPATGHVAKTGTERILIGSAENAVHPDFVIDLVRHRLDVTGYVIALYPTWHPEAGLRTLQLAHASIGTPRFALVPCSLPPLAFSLVADQIGYLAPYVPPGALVALVSALSRVTLAGAWVRSVAGLEHIPASMSDHVASYVPGGGFMVTASPATRIHRVSKGSPLDELAYRPSDPVHLLTGATEGADTEWLQESLLPVVAPAHVRPLAAPPLGETYWGTKKYLEFVAFSAHPKALSVIANSVRCRPCPWCGIPVATSTCPMCSMVAIHGGSPEAFEAATQVAPAEGGAPAQQSGRPRSQGQPGQQGQQPVRQPPHPQAPQQPAPRQQPPPSPTGQPGRQPQQQPSRPQPPSQQGPQQGPAQRGAQPPPAQPQQQPPPRQQPPPAQERGPQSPAPAPPRHNPQGPPPGHQGERSQSPQASEQQNGERRGRRRAPGPPDQGGPPAAPEMPRHGQEDGGAPASAALPFPGHTHDHEHEVLPSPSRNGAL